MTKVPTAEEEYKYLCDVYNEYPADGGVYSAHHDLLRFRRDQSKETKVTADEFDTLKGMLGNVRFSWTEAAKLKPGAVVLAKHDIRFVFRRVMAVGKGMIAFDDGTIEAADKCGIEIEVTMEKVTR